jgi:hypothetical protein
MRNQLPDFLSAFCNPQLQFLACQVHQIFVSILATPLGSNQLRMEEPQGLVRRSIKKSIISLAETLSFFFPDLSLR